METQEYVVRPVEQRDFNAWLRMRRSLWADHPEDRHLSEMEDIAKPGNETIAFVAEDVTGHLAGFIELSIRPFAEGHYSGPVGYVEGIWVDPRHRKRGISRMLLHGAEDWVREKGCTVVGSDCLLDNEIAHRMHWELGFRETGRLVHFLKPL